MMINKDKIHSYQIVIYAKCKFSWFVGSVKFPKRNVSDNKFPNVIKISGLYN